ncbi:MAG: hypothetical protein ACYS0D_13920 [Planctomycetota bacterium]|jgi:hypothetical protein
MDLKRIIVGLLLAAACCVPWRPAAAHLAAALQAEEPPADTEEEQEADALPSLDDLLGLEAESRDTGAQEAAQRQAREELERELAETAIHDAFGVALEKMGLTADLLENELDAGLGTQRLQEEILSKLDELIDQAQKQRMSMSSQSQGQQDSSSAQQQPQPRPTDPTGQQRTQSGESSPGGPPGRQDGDINRVLEETGSEWGNLPPRLRDELIQGRDDRPSSLYRRLTEEYYTRLAREGS